MWESERKLVYNKYYMWVKCLGMIALEDCEIDVCVRMCGLLWIWELEDEIDVRGLG